MTSLSRPPARFLAGRAPPRAGLASVRRLGPRPPAAAPQRAPPADAPSPTLPRDALAGALAGAALTAAAFFGFSSTSLDRDQAATVALFERARPGVVFVTALAESRDAFTLDPTEAATGAGSGVVYDATHILTNAHVVRGAADLRVTLAGGDEYAARVVGVDPDRDVAVLELGDAVDEDEDLTRDVVTFGSIGRKGQPAPQAPSALGRAAPSTDDTPTTKAKATPAELTATNSSRQQPRRPRLTPIPRASSKTLRVGQTVFAIGAPFGLDHTLTSGVLSGLEREVPSGLTGRPIRMVQHEAAINPGNSGGALLDVKGRLVGINTAIFSPGGAGSVGVGFAVPIDAAAASADQIIATGRVTRPILGIALAPDGAAEMLGVRGVLVLDAPPGGPAAAAGVRGSQRDGDGRLIFGDAIVGFNGHKIKSAADLYRALDDTAVGDKVTLALVRGDGKGKESVSVVLGSSGSK